MPPEQVATPSRDVHDPLLERLRLATLGTYDIAGELGRGGMAVVYVARDLKLERTVAIKVMDPRLSLTHGMAERFLQEARIAARLQHPNVIVVHDVQQSEEIIFFVMGLIEGGSIDELCRRPGPLPIDQVRWVLMQAARALAYAHSEGIVHRDVKPANILLNLKGEVILTDFGIAKAVGGDGLTKSGTQIGTPVYMSPEQFSDSPVGPSSDQYALGITAYQMLTGAPPFGGELYALIAAHGNKAPTPIRERRPDCPAFLANAVMRMLEKEPDRRWPSLDDLVDVLGSNMAMDGGAPRKSLAAAARELREARIHTVPALTAITPISPVPTNSKSSQSATPLPEAVVLTISPPAATIFAGGVLDLKVTVSLENGDTLPGAGIRWSSSDTSVVAVSEGGSLRGVAPGTARVRASVGLAAVEAEIRVDEAPLARLVVNTPIVHLLVGEGTKPMVAVFDVTGQTRTDVALEWTSDAPDVVEVDTDAGTLRAVSAGHGIVEVSVGGLRRTFEVTVSRRPIALVRIRATRRTFELGEASALALEAFDDRGGQVAPPGARWTSDQPQVIHVDSQGTALAIAPGTATITAVIDDASDAIQLEAVESAIGALEASVVEPDLLVGESSALSLHVFDTFGAPRSTAGIQIVSVPSEIIRVEPSTLTIYAVRAGEAELVFSAQPPAATVAIERRLSVRVSPRHAVRLDASPAVLDVALGDSATIAVQALDRRGREITDATVRWASDAPSVAAVEPGGVVRVMDHGSALLSASVSNEDGSSVDVRIPLRVRSVSRETAVAIPADMYKAAPSQPADPLPSATALFGGAKPIPAQRVAATVAAETGDGVGQAGQGRSMRPILSVGVAAVLVVVGVWFSGSKNGGRSETSGTPVPQDSLSTPVAKADTEGKAVGQLVDPPIATRVDTVPPEAAPPTLPVQTREPAGVGMRDPKPRTDTLVTRRKAASSPERVSGATGARIQVGVTAGGAPGSSPTVSPIEAPSSGPPVSPAPAVETPAETPSDGDIRREAESVRQDLIRTRGVGTALSEFWGDGSKHAIIVVGEPRLLGETGNATRAQFTMEFKKMNSGGLFVRFTSQVTLEVTKRNGQVSAGAPRFSPLAPSK